MPLICCLVAIHPPEVPEEEAEMAAQFMPPRPLQIFLFTHRRCWKSSATPQWEFLLASHR